MLYATTIASVMPICSVDRVRITQCRMQLTAARFRHQWHLKQQSSAAGRCASAFMACTC